VKAVLQRVDHASVQAEAAMVGEVGRGLLAFLGVAEGDTEEDARRLAEKTVHLRIFNDAAGRFNLSVVDIEGEILAVSQFTLLADARKGRRPSFTGAAPPEEAERLFDYFVEQVRRAGVPVKTGRFGAHMHVTILNDGPVTIVLDSREFAPAR